MDGAAGAGRDDDARQQYGIAAAACLLGCEIKPLGDPGTLRWRPDTAADFGCRDSRHVFHVVCADDAGVWADDYRRCGEPPSSFRGLPATSAGGVLLARAWVELRVQNRLCTVDWRPERAHDKGCRGGSRIYHARCEAGEGSWSTACADMPTGMFLGLPMTAPPRRLADRAWTEVAVADASCSLTPAYAWNERGAHYKGCWSGQAVYHVRCEDQRGNWSTQCPAMASGRFKGKTMAAQPVRLPDRAWTEVRLRGC